MDIKKMTIGEVEEIKQYFGASNHSANITDHPYTIGSNYFIRTVTNIYTGRLLKVTQNELVLEDVAWIADTGRFANALKDFSLLDEVEPYPSVEVIIGRGAIIDAHQTSCELPRYRK